MKAFPMRKLLFAVMVSLTLFISCTKTDLHSDTSTSSLSKSSVTTENSFTNDDEFTTEVTDSGTTIITYRPGPNNGCDVYTDLYDGSHSANQNYVLELPINVWEYGGLIVTRSFIKFPKLYKFPDSLTLVSAKLYLYPPKDFLNHPQGNTGANECVIQRVTSKNWQEDSLTWDNQPKGVTTEDEAFIPATTDQFGYAPVIDVTALIKKFTSLTVPNYGMRITLSNEQPLAAVNFASSEAVDKWRRPMLKIEYK